MVSLQTSAPVLSTPDTHIFEDPTDPIDVSSLPKLPDEQVHITYEIERTVREIREGRWKRIALQFPDEMLVNAPRVYEGLVRGLKRRRAESGSTDERSEDVGTVNEQLETLNVKDVAETTEEKVFILADTSYGSCCVDEVAAEHVDADVVVHYGRSCLSPTARLPVVYVFTTQTLDLEQVVRTFEETYPDHVQKVVLMADIPYSQHIPALADRLTERGYAHIFPTEVTHQPSSPIPNRTVPSEVSTDISRLREYQIFHVSDPPTSLLLTLASRAGAIQIYPTASSTTRSRAILASSAATLRRRYALLTSLSTASIFGILINTLSVKNYLGIAERVKQMIASAGKKSYTFVVGKINPAKVANFSEIGGWVVIGCWESSLIESKDFYRPIITPFELSLTLQTDSERTWTGEWTSDFEAVLRQQTQAETHAVDDQADEQEGSGDIDSDEESAPPEFDLRTGRYVSRSRPMRLPGAKPADHGKSESSRSLVKRANGDMVQIGGVVSPGAEYLREQRTWKGLGSEFPGDGEGTAGGAASIEEGRSGIAKGYTGPGSSNRT